MSTVLKKETIPQYLELIERFPLIHITNAAQHKLASKMLDELIDRSSSGTLNTGERAY
jgi:hypothetical protein